MPRPTIKLYDAIQRMRDLSAKNIPFSFSFIGYSEQTQSSSGYKEVTNALIRKGYRDDQSDLSNILVAYTDMKDETPRQFYLPLLMTFNEYIIQP